MRANDLEANYNKIVEIIKENLNDKIDQLNLEFDDSTPLKNIDENAFYTSLEGEVIQFDPYVYIDIIGTRGKDREVYAEIFCSICFADRSISEENKRINLRYSRAMQEVLLENQHQMQGVGAANLEVVQIPYGARIQEQQQTKVAGCEVGFTLAY